MAKQDLIKKLADLGVTTTGVTEQLAEAGITPITGEEVNKDLEALIERVEAIVKPADGGDQGNAPAAPEGDQGNTPDGGTAPAAPEAPVAPAAPAASQPSAPEEPKAKKDDGKPQPITKAPKSGSVDITRGTSYVRSFSEEVHGADYFELAQQFAGKEAYAKREYKIYDSADIPEVIVLYREKEDAEKPLDQQSPDAPFVDKERKFDDKDAALSFNIAKKGAIMVPAIR